MSPAAEDIALALDPCLIMERAGMRADDWQRSFLMDPLGWYLILSSRQAGKTSVGAVLAVWQAIAEPGSLTVVAAPAEKQAREMMREVNRMYAACRGHDVGDDDLLSLRLETSAGSRVVAISDTERTVRGLSGVKLIVADEGARISGDLFNTIVPFLATSGGRMVIMSTPWFRRGFMYDRWRDPEGWVKVKVTADEVPRISREFLERERRTKPRSWFLQEYYCEWGASATALIEPELVDAAVCHELAPYRPTRARFARAA